MPLTSEVFGISTRMNSYSYVDRSNLDKEFSRYLRRNMHIAITGPSKCGKSWLRQKCMSDAIVIQCRLDMGAVDIYKEILSTLNAKFDVGKEITFAANEKLSAEGQLGLAHIANAKTQGNIEFSQEKSISTEVDFNTSSNNLRYVADSVKKSGKRVVIEDFHYLSLETREKLAHDMKTLWDYECYFIIIGVWTQTNLLTAMNPDLTGRIVEISVSWTDEDLKRVIDKGCAVLNVAIDPVIKNELIKDSFKNVGILQSLLLLLIEDESGYEKTQIGEMHITEPRLYKEAAEKYATQLDGVYQQFAKTLSQGIRSRKKSTGIYALAMQAIVSGTDDELMNGLSRNKIFMYANGKEPRVQKGNLKTVLGKLVDLQKPESGKGLVISYDEATDVIFVVDYQLLFYRKHHVMRWPWEEMIEEAQQESLFDEDKE